jgi:hypothetical protein
MLKSIGSHPFRSLPPGRRAPRPVGRVCFVVPKVSGNDPWLTDVAAVLGKRDDGNGKTLAEDISFATSP